MVHFFEMVLMAFVLCTVACSTLSTHVHVHKRLCAFLMASPSWRRAPARACDGLVCARAWRGRGQPGACQFASSVSDASKFVLGGDKCLLFQSCTNLSEIGVGKVVPDEGKHSSPIGTFSCLIALLQAIRILSREQYILPSSSYRCSVKIPTNGTCRSASCLLPRSGSAAFVLNQIMLHLNRMGIQQGALSNARHNRHALQGITQCVLCVMCNPY